LRHGHALDLQSTHSSVAELEVDVLGGDGRVVVGRRRGLALRRRHEPAVGVELLAHEVHAARLVLRR